jgi:predicted nucleic acid-binding Zn ribbon protein
MSIHITDKELLDDLVRVYKLHNSIPDTALYRKDGKYHKCTLARRFGSWHDAIVKCFGKSNRAKRKPVVAHPCAFCGKETKNPKFCSHSCAACFNNNGVRRKGVDPGNCPGCGDKLKSSRHKYCSHDCMEKYEYNSYINRWLRGLENGMKGEGISVYIRKYIFKEYGEKCQKCGWREKNPHTDRIPLTIHHKDGDWRNNKKENLEILCPNCHSLTETYGSRNRGNGRRSRYKNMPYTTQKPKEFDQCPICNGKKEKGLKFCSNKCSHVSQKRFDVTKEELTALVNEKSYSEIGRIFGVTCNAIKKRCKVLGVELLKR